MSATWKYAISAAMLIGLAGDNSVYGQAAPAAPVAGAAVAGAPVAGPPTLWNFLGIPQGVKKVQGALTNRRGNRPRLEPKEPLKALNDPMNLFSENKAIKKAAEVKVQEDLKPQKIKAIKYLTSIGCGCYDKDGEVTAALIASADDCTEDVRLMTMQQIEASARNKCCSNCGQVCCCNEKMLKKLAEIAYERNSDGCHKEPSARVREAAACALRACCPNGEPPLIVPEEPEKKDPDKKDLNQKETEKDDAIKENQNKESDDPIKEAQDKLDEDAPKTKEDLKNDAPDTLIRIPKPPLNIRSSLQRPSSQSVRPVHVKVADQVETHPVRTTNYDVEVDYEKSVRSLGSNPHPDGGVIISYNADTQIAHVHFSNRNINIEVGQEVYVRQNATAAGGFKGTWQVLTSNQGCVRMKPTEMSNRIVIRSGDHVFLGMPEVTVAPVGYFKR